MYNLLIADDEKEEREVIKFLLNKFNYNMKISEACDGRAALEIIKSESIDILITDIKMPFMDGIELTSYVRDMKDDIQILFFSGHDDFELARHAITLNAVDYLLKPINPTDFDKAMLQIVERLDLDNEENNQKESYEKNYILSRVISGVPYENIKTEFYYFDVSFLESYRRLIILEFDEDFFGRYVIEIDKFNEQIQKVTNLYCDILDFMPAQGILFFSDELGDEIFGIKAQEIIDWILTGYNKKCYISISSNFKGIRESYEMYKDSESRLEKRFFYGNTFLFMPFGSGTSILAENSHNRLEQLMNTIQKDITEKDIGGLKAEIDLFFEECMNESDKSYIFVNFQCANILKLLYMELGSYKENDLVKAVETLFAYPSLDMTREYLSLFLGGLEKHWEKDSPNHIVHLVKRYINEHYGEELSLDILAEKVYISSHYLCSTFKNIEGIGINHYIRDVRMRKAKELLLNTNIKINEICSRVGYSNLSYFCKNFRNEYGVTPEKYRSNV